MTRELGARWSSTPSASTSRRRATLRRTDLAAEVDMTLSTIKVHVHRLIEDGKIDMTPRCPRTLVVL